jgi:hypothetical protein
MLIYDKAGHELTQIISIHDSIATWRKGSKTLNVVTIYPRNMSIPDISMICPAITVESSTSFKASSSLQVATKTLLATSKSARGIGSSKS